MKIILIKVIRKEQENNMAVQNNLVKAKANQKLGFTSYLTQDAVKEQINKLVCGQNTIYKWLRKDVMPNLCFIMLMSDIFNVSTDYLIYGTESR